MSCVKAYLKDFLYNLFDVLDFWIGGGGAAATTALASFSFVFIVHKFDS